MNFKALNIKGLIKIHKTNNPIKPIVNFREEPANKLSKHLTDIINQYMYAQYLQHKQFCKYD